MNDDSNRQSRIDNLKRPLSRHTASRLVKEKLMIKGESHACSSSMRLAQCVQSYVVRTAQYVVCTMFGSKLSHCKRCSAS